METLWYISRVGPKYNLKALTSERGMQESERRRCDDGNKVWTDEIAAW